MQVEATATATVTVEYLKAAIRGTAPTVISQLWPMRMTTPTAVTEKAATHTVTVTMISNSSSRRHPGPR